MIILDNTNRSLEVVLDAAVAANQLPCVASYVDVSQTDFALAAVAANTAQSNDTTAVTLVAAPAADTSRQVKYVAICNRDTGPVTITVRLNDNATLRDLVTFTLDVNETLEYTDGKGWRRVTGDRPHPKETFAFAASDESSDLTIGTAKVTFRMPYAFNLDEARASVSTAPAGSELVVDINKDGTSILSTKLSIDAGEKTSTTAVAPPVISDNALAEDSEITVDVDQVGSSTPGAGLKVYLIGNRT